MRSIRNKDQGFVLLESIVSLSILAVFVGLVLPFSMELLMVREQATQEVELSRFLYEAAQFYDKDEPKNTLFESGEVSAESVETSRSINLYSSGKEVISLDLLSVEWKAN